MVGGTLTDGRILHFDGEAWTEQATPRSVPLLNWVFGFSSSNVVAVGNGGTILSYDGTTWTRAQSPTTEDLWGIWGANKNDLWAVGGSGRSESTATVLHFDGKDWEEWPLPTLKIAARALFKVWGTSAQDVYAVGQRGIVLHFDGRAWSEVDVAATDDLIALWGTGPNNILAVGGRGNGLVSHFNGRRWRTLRLFDLPGINGVWMQEPNVAHLAVTRGHVAILELETLTAKPQVLTEGLDFHAVFGVDDVLTAVGGNFNMLGDQAFQGIAQQRQLDASE